MTPEEEYKQWIRDNKDNLKTRTFNSHDEYQQYWDDAIITAEQAESLNDTLKKMKSGHCYKSPDGLSTDELIEWALEPDLSDQILLEVQAARNGPEEEAPDGLTINEQIEWLFNIED